MKYCTHCGKELLDEAVICVGCGCAVGGQNAQTAKDQQADGTTLMNTLSQRVNTNAIIWLVIGVLQIIGGVFLNLYLLVGGVLSFISSVRDMKYSKELLENPAAVVAKLESITGALITLVCNLVIGCVVGINGLVGSIPLSAMRIIGGMIGIVGSIYYFVAIQGYVMKNKKFLAELNEVNK